MNTYTEEEILEAAGKYLPNPADIIYQIRLNRLNRLLDQASHRMQTAAKSTEVLRGMDNLRAQGRFDEAYAEVKRLTEEIETMNRRKTNAV